MSNFRPTDRLTGYLMPPSVDEWLPQRHLARFVVEVVEGLDLRAMSKAYRGSGSASYHPAPLLSMLIYGYATGVFSSRKLERATYDSVAFRFIAANDHPDQDTIATFRRRFLKDIAALFVRVLELAREMGLLKLGTVALDGTKIHANANRHSALSYEHAGKIEAQLKAEVAELLARAEAADHADVPDGMSIPDELARREKRLAKLAQARAKERFEREAAEHKAKLAAREAKAKATGSKPTGKPPQPPVEGARPTDQINLTDEASRIMPVTGRGFEQCYNAQAVVAADSLLVIAAQVVQAPNDTQQIEPMLAQGRQSDYPPLSERFAKVPSAPENPTPLEAMSHRLQTPEGKKLYALRKQIPEPVFGIIKSAMGFRQFLLRGLENVQGEWTLVTMAWNMKRMLALAVASGAWPFLPARK